MNNISTRPSHCCSLLTAALAISLPSLAQTSSGDNGIKALIVKYATSIDRADTAIADQIFSNAPEITFIHPRGEEHGRDQIEADV